MSKKSYTSSLNEQNKRKPKPKTDWFSIIPFVMGMIAILLVTQLVFR